MVALSRRNRSLLALAMALLLLTMQHEALRHAISHFRVAHDQHELSSPPIDAHCVECSILATGTAAAPACPLVVEAATPTLYLLIAPAYVAPALAPTSTHYSRAPPVLS